MCCFHFIIVLIILKIIRITFKSKIGSFPEMITIFTKRTHREHHKFLKYLKDTHIYQIYKFTLQEQKARTSKSLN